jgi:FlaA1/EpsC-like NDP-sugar epimerase
MSLPTHVLVVGATGSIGRSLPPSARTSTART